MRIVHAIHAPPPSTVRLHGWANSPSCWTLPGSYPPMLCPSFPALFGSSLLLPNFPPSRPLRLAYLILDTLPPRQVGVNKDSYLILDTLPPEYDSRVKAMEVDEKPTEDYSDVGGLDKQIQVRYARWSVDFLYSGGGPLREEGFPLRVKVRK